MTANGTAKTPPGILTAIVAWFQTALRLLGRIALGGLALVVAGIIASAMALIGLLIAMAALIFRFTKSGQRHAPRPSQSHNANRQKGTNPEEGVILEARQTGQGWTVE